MTAQDVDGNVMKLILKIILVFLLAVGALYILFFEGPANSWDPANSPIVGERVLEFYDPPNVPSIGPYVGIPNWSSWIWRSSKGTEN